MKDTSGPAFPVPHQDIDLNGRFVKIGSPGLTKREEFAKAAMQGLLSNPAMIDTFYGISNVAIEAVKAADALLAELEKE